MTVRSIDSSPAGALSGPALAIVSFSKFLDDYGAETWSLRVVALVMAAFFYIVRIVLGKSGGVDWYPLAHATLTGIGSLMCMYLDIFWAETMTGIPEPIRNAQCGAPLTSLHTILPAVTMGYSLLDFLDGLALGPEYVAHGIATFSVMAFFCESGIAHLMTPMLLMEVSSIFLALLRTRNLRSNMLLVCQALFVLSFFVFRVVAVPYLWFERVLAVGSEVAKNPQYANCLPRYFNPVVPAFGLFFHTLNFFWFCKIVQKMHRKISGAEKIDENNGFGDENDLRKKK